MNVLQPITKFGALAYLDLLHFANSLVYDERTDTCFAYDPRDAHKRRLALLATEECEVFDCFDCSYTAGKCMWDTNFNECQKPATIEGAEQAR